VRLLLSSWVCLAACGFQLNPTGGPGIDARSDGALDHPSPRRLMFDNPTVSPLVEFPVLVVLEPSKINYGAIADPRTDLRFEDLDGTTLPFDIETWDPTGRSSIWVRVPQIDASSSTDSILVHFGAGVGANNIASDLVWSRYELVTHLGATAVDAANSYDGTVTNATAGAGQIGDATRFTGANQEVRYTTSGMVLTDWDAWSFEMWIQPQYATLVEAEGQPNAVIGKGPNTSIQGGRIEHMVGEPELWFQVDVHFSTGTPAYLNTDLPLGEWSHILYTSNGTTMELYRNGIVVGSANRSATLDTTQGAIVLGGNSPMLGAIDELRISDTGFGPDWIRAQHLSMTGLFVTFTDP
jgi:hypothetical protein